MALIGDIRGLVGGTFGSNPASGGVGAVDRSHLPAYNFVVQLDFGGTGAGGQRDVASCSEVSGLECDLKTVEYQEGGNNEFMHAFRGQASYPRLVLKRGLMASDELWRWHQDVIAGIVQRRNGCVTLLDAGGDEAMRWTFLAAMPVKWSVATLNASQSALAFESIEFVHRGLSLQVLGNSA